VENALVAVAPSERPIRLVVRDDDLRRSRLTVFFRLFLAIPHLVWLLLWSIAVNVVVLILWLAILIEGQVPKILHDFVAGYLRYATHVGAYLFLAANAYPGFRGEPGYPVDVEIDPPARQSRWATLFRLVLAFPAILLTAALGGSWVIFAVGALYFSGAGGMAAFLTWFVAVVRGTAPRGLRDLATYTLGYGAQAGGYLLLLTDRYPSSDPALLEPLPELPEHPVRAVVSDELGRSRLTILFRLLLSFPHLVWLTLWAVPALFAVVAAWLVALVTGRVPTPLHRFLAAYVRYWTHVVAYLYVIGRRFPGFTGREGSYGIDVRIDPPKAQSRWKTLFRLLLAIPGLLVASALSNALFVLAILGWWVGLVLGRMPEGLRDLGASCLRYTAQTYAYLGLLTDRYPYASPVLEGKPRVVDAPERALPWDAF
jgi:Domain of unknown function (DUF4389)